MWNVPRDVPMNGIRMTASEEVLDNGNVIRSWSGSNSSREPDGQPSRNRCAE